MTSLKSGSKKDKKRCEENRQRPFDEPLWVSKQSNQ